MKYSHWYFTHSKNKADFPNLIEELGSNFIIAFSKPVWTAIRIEDCEDCHKLDEVITKETFLYEWGNKVYIYCDKINELKIQKLFDRLLPKKGNK